MSQSFSFQCSKCDAIHEGVPSFSFDAPALYYDIPEIERENRTFLTSDACVIDDEYFFAKGLLELPVDGLEETLTFTPWVSLSEVNFLKFQESLDIADASQYEPMFGWFCNRIDGFGDCEGLKTNLIFQNNNNRPYINIERSEHLLSSAYHDGISQESMIAIVEGYLHRWTK